MEDCLVGERCSCPKLEVPFLWSETEVDSWLIMSLEVLTWPEDMKAVMYCACFVMCGLVVDL